MSDDTTVSLDDLGETDNSTSSSSPIQTPAISDSQAASGHEPDPTSDDDVDEMGEELGLSYTEDEPLDIAGKVPVTTLVEPPEEDEI